jgi:tRNA (mo5U34)-methyltransferase
MQTSPIQDKVEQLKPWFHNLHLPGGVQTAPDHFLGDFPSFKWKELSTHIPVNLSGWKVLDIGCNAGYYTFQLAQRGAFVVGIDLDEHYLKQARWAAKVFGLEGQVEFRQQQVYDLAHVDEQYDLVIFMGVFYHLRYPLLALDIVTQKVGKLLVFQTLMMPGKKVKAVKDDYPINEREEMMDEGWPKMAFIEKKLAGDPTNWWAPNQAAVEAMLRTCGFEIFSKPLEETVICIPKNDQVSDLRGWNYSEYLSAVGKDWKEAVAPKTGKQVP